MEQTVLGNETLSGHAVSLPRVLPRLQGDFELASKGQIHPQIGHCWRRKRKEKCPRSVVGLQRLGDTCRCQLGVPMIWSTPKVL